MTKEEFMQIQNWFNDYCDLLFDLDGLQEQFKGNDEIHNFLMNQLCDGISFEKFKYFLREKRKEIWRTV